MTVLIRMISLATLVAISVLGTTTACSQSSPAPAPASPPPAPAETSPPPAPAVDKTTDVATPHPALREPILATATAPAAYKVKLETTKGDVVIEVTRAWAPNGADRFYNLVKIGYYDGTAFFRVVKGFVAQIGLNGDPEVTSAWKQATIPDDPIVTPNTRGTVTFAMSGPDTRTTQFYINYGDNTRLKDYGAFAPFGKVVSGMDVVDALYSGYGEGAPRGSGPDQARITMEGNAYLKAEFPELDSITRATIVE